MADCRETTARLHQVEQEMTDVLRQMRAEGQSRERLLVAGLVLASLQSALDELADTAGLPQATDEVISKALAG